MTKVKQSIFILVFSFFCNFLPSSAESNFKPPVLNPSDLAFNGHIYAIAVDEMTGIVYVGGEFTKIGEMERNHSAAIGPDGTLLDWNPNVSGNVSGNFIGSSYRTINVIAISGSMLYVGGDFTQVGDETRANFASFSIPE